MGLGAKILVATGVSRETSSELILVFKKGLKISSIHTKFAARFPGGNSANMRFGSFGGICNGNILVGYEKDVYQYNPKDDKWCHVLTTESEPFDRILMQSCSIADMLLLYGGSGNINVQLLKLKHY